MAPVLPILVNYLHLKRYTRRVPRAAGDIANVGNAARFELDATLDPSLRALAEKVLPVCVAYSSVAQFTDGKDMLHDG